MSTRKSVDVAAKKENYCPENCHSLVMEYQIPCSYEATAYKMISQRDIVFSSDFLFISRKVSESVAV